MDQKVPFVVLIVLDGWGVAPPSIGNAITLANPPTMNRLWATYPHTLLAASGEAVGLPRGEAGNTETGHLNLGAGKIVYQDLPRINLAIADGSFFRNETLLGAFAHARSHNSKVHIMGLIGAGGVHSNIEHLFALVRLAKEQQFQNVFLHLFTDGRDSPPDSALTYVQKVEEVIKTEKVGRIASIMGRYWAMDRDFRWERTGKAYNCLIGKSGQLGKDAREIIEKSYKDGKTDEFLEPTLVTGEDAKPVGTIGDNDAVVFFNFRIDRPRQLTKAFILTDFAQTAQKQTEFDPYMVKYYKKHLAELPERAVFSRGEHLKNLYFVTMTQYEKHLPAHIAFPPEVIDLPLGRVLSIRGMRQLRAAESEKERFVTFYFNGQQEETLPGEERVIIASPNVATYDLKPEMSARELTSAFLDRFRLDPTSYGFVLINFANPDMVGHTGNIEAAKRAIITVDSCIADIVREVLRADGVVMITADHGNVEEMINIQTGAIDTEHSTNYVPFIVAEKRFLGQSKTLPTGILADVAPTVLSLLGIEKPGTMTGRNLLM